MIDTMVRHGHGIIEEKHKDGKITEHHITHEEGYVFRSDRNKPTKHNATRAFIEAEKARAEGALDVLFALTEDGLGATDLNDMYEYFTIETKDLSKQYLLKKGIHYLRLCLVKIKNMQRI